MMSHLNLHGTFMRMCTLFGSNVATNILSSGCSGSNCSLPRSSWILFLKRLPMGVETFNKWRQWTSIPSKGILSTILDHYFQISSHLVLWNTDWQDVVVRFSWSSEIQEQLSLSNFLGGIMDAMTLPMEHSHTLTPIIVNYTIITIITSSKVGQIQAKVSWKLSSYVFEFQR